VEELYFKRSGVVRFAFYLTAYAPSVKDGTWIFIDSDGSYMIKDSHAFGLLFLFGCELGRLAGISMRDFHEGYRDYAPCFELSGDSIEVGGSIACRFPNQILTSARLAYFFRHGLYYVYRVMVSLADRGRVVVLDHKQVLVTVVCRYDTFELVGCHCNDDCECFESSGVANILLALGGIGLV